MANLTDSDVQQSGTFDLWDGLPDTARFGVTVGGVYKEVTLGVLRTQLAVAAENQAPRVTLTIPTQYIELGQSVALMADASDSDGQVVRLVFLDFDDKVGEATTPRANISVTPTELGSHTYSVKAYDNSGASTQSDPVPVVVRRPGLVKADPPTNVVATLSGSNISVNATPPVNQGSGPVDGYQVFRDGLGYPMATSVALPFLDTTAVPGTPRYYKLEAHNEAGDSAMSAASNSVTVPTTAPTFNTTVNSVSPTADVVTFAGLTGVDFLFNSPLPTGDPGPFTMSIFAPDGTTQLASIDATPACAGVACAVVYQGVTYQTTFVNGNRTLA